MKTTSKPSESLKREPTSHIYNWFKIIFSYESHIINLLRGDLRMGKPTQTIINSKLH